MLKATRPTFSTAWTVEDRLRLTILLTHMIRDDLYQNAYGRKGRPNIQSIHEMVVALAAELERYRSTIEPWVDAFGRDRLFAHIPVWDSAR